MNRFFHLNLGKRLGLGFAVVIILGILSSIVADLRLSEATRNTQDLVDNQVLKKDYMAAIKEQLNLQARAIRNVILSHVQEVRELESQRIHEARARNNELMAQLNKLIRTEEERALFSQIDELKQLYEENADLVLEFVQLKAVESARMHLTSEQFRELQGDFFGSLDQLAALQNTLMTEAVRQMEKNAEMTRWLLMGSSLVGIVLSLVIAYYLTRGIVRQLGGEPEEAVRVVREIAQGNLSVPIKLQNQRQDSLMHHMKLMQQNLIRLVRRVREDSMQVARASTEIADGSVDLSARTTQQASAIQQTAASMEELNVTVQQNIDNAAQADQLAKNAAKVTQQAGEMVSAVVRTMDEIDQSSQKVSEIINVIDSIAFQTNILALNAAVEAARAGEQGRGFAVVAAEVRALAQRSAASAQEIQELIGDSVEKVSAGNSQVHEAGEIMQKVVRSIHQVTEIMAEIAAAGREQGSGVAQVGTAVEQMEQVTQQNASWVEQMSAAAAALNKQAEHLVETVAIFNIEGLEGSAQLTSNKPKSKKIQLALVKA